MKWISSVYIACKCNHEGVQGLFSDIIKSVIPLLHFTMLSYVFVISFSNSSNVYSHKFITTFILQSLLIYMYAKLC